MASLKNIKLKIGSVQKTRQVTKAMEAVSAVKMRKTQQQALVARPYATAALSILERLSGSVDLKNHPLTQIGHPMSNLKTCIVIITSDKGLAGSLNSSVLRTTEKAISERGITKEQAVLMCIGRRGADYFATRGWDVRERLESVGDTVRLENLHDSAQRILAWHAEGEIGKCIAVYTNFLSTFEQKAVVRELIPITQESLQEFVAGILPVKGKFSGEAGEDVHPAAYTIEPSADEVFAEILPRLVSVALFHALAEAKASEHSARMVAMKSATDKAGEIVHDLTLAFNKARQAAITGEVSEITSGIEALK